MTPRTIKEVESKLQPMELQPYMQEMLLKIGEISAVEYAKLQSFIGSLTPLADKKHVEFEVLTRQYEFARKENLPILTWQMCRNHDPFTPYIVNHLRKNEYLREVSMSRTSFEAGISAAHAELRRLYNFKYHPELLHTPKGELKLNTKDTCPITPAGRHNYYYYDASMGSFVRVIGPKTLNLNFMPTYHYVNILKAHFEPHAYFLGGHTFKFAPAVDLEHIDDVPTVHDFMDVTSMFHGIPPATCPTLWPKNLKRLIIPKHFLFQEDLPLFVYLRHKYARSNKFYSEYFSLTQNMYLQFLKDLDGIDPERIGRPFAYKHKLHLAETLEKEIDEDDFTTEEVLAMGGDVTPQEMAEILNSVIPASTWNDTMLQLYKELNDKRN